MANGVDTAYAPFVETCDLRTFLMAIYYTENEQGKPACMFQMLRYESVFVNGSYILRFENE